MNIEIANRLVELRKKSGYSQEELADKLGLSRQAVSKWERAESSPDTDNLICLARLYNVSLDDLLNTNQSVDDIVRNVKDKEEEKKANDSVRIDDEGIHVKSKEGETVEITGNRIHIYDKDGNVIDKRKSKTPLYEIIIDSITPLICAITFFLLGYFVPEIGFGKAWLVFLLIPIVPSICSAIRKKRFCEFCYPVLAVLVFFILGFSPLALWHPGWVVFITIPVFYSIFGPIDKAIHNEPQDDGIKVEYNDDED